jgi:hypothetical protein
MLAFAGISISCSLLLASAFHARFCWHQHFMLAFADASIS